MSTIYTNKTVYDNTINADKTTQSRGV